MRAHLSERTGLASQQILVGCVHTHSGPDTGVFEHVAGKPEPAHATKIFEAVVRAGEDAVAASTPARLGVGHARARIGRNRRVEGGPLDEDVLVVRVDDAAGAPRALLYVHGCHPTALGHENRLL